MTQWAKTNDAIGTVNRGFPCESGLCTLCDSACKGKCETWLSALKGRSFYIQGTLDRLLQAPGWYLLKEWVTMHSASMDLHCAAFQ